MKALLRKDPGGPSLSPFHSELDMSVRAFSISLATTEKRYWYLGSSTIPVSGTGLSFRWFVLPGNEDSWCQSTCCRPDTLLCTAASWCCCCCLRDDAAKAQIACPHSQLVSDRAGIWTQADLCPEPVLTIPWHCLSSNHDILYSDEGNWCQEDMAKKSVNYWRWGEALSLLAFSLFLLFIFKPLKLLSNSQEIGDMPPKYLAQCPAHSDCVFNLCCGFDDDEGWISIWLYVDVHVPPQVAVHWNCEDKAWVGDKCTSTSHVKTREFCPGS